MLADIGAFFMPIYKENDYQLTEKKSIWRKFYWPNTTQWLSYKEKAYQLIFNIRLYIFNITLTFLYPLHLLQWPGIFLMRHYIYSLIAFRNGVTPKSYFLKRYSPVTIFLAKSYFRSKYFTVIKVLPRKLVILLVNF